MIIDMLTHIGRRKDGTYKVESLIELMESSGVDVCMICSQLETIDNDYIFECTKEYPEKTLGFAVINPWDMDGEEELEKCYAKYNFYGLKLNGVRFGFSADRHSLLDPYFDICKKHKKIVVAHNMSDLFSIPEKWAEMAKSYPDVPIIMYHMGVPFMSDSAIQFALEYENIFLSTAGAFVPVMKKALKKIGADKIIFSTDAPYGDMRQEVEKIKYITMNTTEQEKIYYLNICKLLGLNYQPRQFS